MGDPGIALITGAFALAGAGVGAALTAIGANWLQTKQREFDAQMHAISVQEGKLHRDADEKRRLRRESYAPVFAILDELERLLAYREAISTTASVFDGQPDLDERLAAVEAEYPEAHRPIALRVALAALRLEDQDVTTRLILLGHVLGKVSFDWNATAAEMRRLRHAVIEHAARLESAPSP